MSYRMMARVASDAGERGQRIDGATAPLLAGWLARVADNVLAGRGEVLELTVEQSGTPELPTPLVEEMHGSEWR